MINEHHEEFLFICLLCFSWLFSLLRILLLLLCHRQSACLLVLFYLKVVFFGEWPFDGTVFQHVYLTICQNQFFCCIPECKHSEYGPDCIGFNDIYCCIERGINVVICAIDDLFYGSDFNLVIYRNFFRAFFIPKV